MIKTVLVTGGNGFLGLHLIAQLLAGGYTVKTSLRSMDKAAGVTAALATHDVPHRERLSFVVADLTADAGWADAMVGVDGVFATAAPVFVNGEMVADTVARTATDGVLRILTAARHAGVQRVVMTGNWGAVGYSNHDRHSVTTEANWTDPDEPGLSVYERSKLLAERAAWQFAHDHPGQPELVTVNASAMLGRSLNDHVSGSLGLVQNLLSGRSKAIPQIPLNVVDVSDVAALHLLAMTKPAAAGHRFIASADGQITLPEIAALIRTQRPAVAAKVPRRLLPNWVIRLAAPFSAQAREGLLFLRTNRNTSIAAAKRLGWQPQYTITDTILRTVDQLTGH
ncbi:NAD-dependent epimerase/dehydratase family protein [Lacticaseibacillus thailandensis]|nr:NAD-dependent epimerase/dehydratase family protein [Lacticaseibacillus thailandensis]